MGQGRVPEAIARVVRSGVRHNLHTLDDVPRDGGSSMGEFAASFLTSVVDHPLPSLIKLSINIADLEGNLLGRTVDSGAFPVLEEITLHSDGGGDYDDDDDGCDVLTSFFTVLEKGNACPHLKGLALINVVIASTAFDSLLSVLRSPVLSQRLQGLHLSELGFEEQNQKYDDIITSLRYCRDLRALRLYSGHPGLSFHYRDTKCGSRALLHALQDCSWPRLEVLEMKSFPLPSKWVLGLKEVVDGGGLDSVVELTVVSGHQKENEALKSAVIKARASDRKKVERLSIEYFSKR